MRKEERRKNAENGKRTGKAERWQKKKLRENSGKPMGGVGRGEGVDIQRNNQHILTTNI